MGNRPGKYTGPPPSSGGGGSRGDGILGKLMAPKLNDQFGKTATGADPDDGVAIREQEAQNAASQNLYNTPTGWQRFFAPEASQRADTANADLSAHRVLSKENAASSLYNAQELNRMQQGFNVLNAETAHGFNKDTAATQVTAAANVVKSADARADELTNRGFTDIGNATLFGDTVPAFANGMTPEQIGRIISKQMGNKASTDGIGSLPSYKAGVNRDASASRLAEQGSDAAFNFAANPANAAKMLSGRGTQLDIANAIGANDLDAEKRFGMDARRHKVGQLAVGAMANVGMGGTSFMLSPEANLTLSGPTKTERPTTISIGGNTFPGKPEEVFTPGSRTGAMDMSPTGIANRDAAMRAASKNQPENPPEKPPPSLVPPRVDKTPAATELAAITQGEEAAKIADEFSSNAQKIRDFNMRKMGGQPFDAIYGPEGIYTPPGLTQPAEGAALKRLLAGAANLQIRQKAILDSRKKPVSKQ